MKLFALFDTLAVECWYAINLSILI